MKVRGQIKFYMRILGNIVVKKIENFTGMNDYGDNYRGRQNFNSYDDGNRFLQQKF